MTRAPAVGRGVTHRPPRPPERPPLTRVLLVAALLLPAIVQASATEEPLFLSIDTRVQSDTEGEVGARVDARIGASRWVLLGGGVWDPFEERLAPGGYIERRYAPDELLSESWSAIGAAAGPVVFGPLDARGLYARAVDPTGGGWSWGALSDRDRFSLDASLEPPSRRGLSLAHSAEVGVGGGAWAIEDRHGTLWRGASLSAAGARALPGKLSLLLGETILPDAPRTEEAIAEDGWLYEVPPLRTDRYLRAGASWRVETNGRAPDGARPALSLLNEFWLQREGRAPIPWVYSGAMRLDFGAWKVAARAVAVEAGYLDAWGARVDRSRLLAAGAEGRLGATADRRTWRVAWEHAAGWDEGAPGGARQELSARVSRRSRGRILERRALELSVELEPAAEDGTAAHGNEERSPVTALFVEPWPFLTDARVAAAGAELSGRLLASPGGAAYLGGEASLDWERDADGLGTSLSLTPGWSRAVGSHGRTLAVEAEITASLEVGKSEWIWESGLAASIPLAVGGRVSFDLSYEDHDLEGRVVLEWSMSPVIGRGSPAPLQNRS